MEKCREAFERFECEKYQANYDDMKKNWDWYESQFGYRYSPESLRGKDWEVWQKAWQHQQAKVEELQKRVDAVKGLAQVFWEKSNEKHNQGKVWESKALGECADEILDVLEQALKGGGNDA